MIRNRASFLVAILVLGMTSGRAAAETLQDLTSAGYEIRVASVVGPTGGGSSAQLLYLQKDSSVFICGASIVDILRGSDSAQLFKCFRVTK